MAKPSSDANTFLGLISLINLQGRFVGFVHLVVVLNPPLVINCSLRLLS